MGSSLPPLITSRSLYLLTFTFFSCSHAGICNVITDAVKTLNRPIYMVIGGMHLAPPDQVYRIAPTVEFISKSLRPAPTYVLPMHCTGFKAKIALEHELGEGCVPAGVGMKVSNVLCLQLTLGSLTARVLLWKCSTTLKETKKPKRCSAPLRFERQSGSRRSET